MIETARESPGHKGAGWSGHLASSRQSRTAMVFPRTSGSGKTTATWRVRTDSDIRLVLGRTGRFGIYSDRQLRALPQGCRWRCPDWCRFHRSAVRLDADFIGVLFCDVGCAVELVSVSDLIRGVLSLRYERDAPVKSHGTLSSDRFAALRLGRNSERDATSPQD
jgi:hypothetical protein